MIKHNKFTEIQSFIGRVPRSDEFIALLNSGSFKRSTTIKGVIQMETRVSSGDPRWTYNYRALVKDGAVLCVYQDGGNESHYHPERTVRRVLNIK